MHIPTTCTRVNQSKLNLDNLNAPFPLPLLSDMPARGRASLFVSACLDVEVHNSHVHPLNHYTRQKKTEKGMVFGDRRKKLVGGLVLPVVPNLFYAKKGSYSGMAGADSHKARYKL